MKKYMLTLHFQHDIVKKVPLTKRDSETAVRHIRSCITSGKPLQLEYADGLLVINPAHLLWLETEEVES